MIYLLHKKGVIYVEKNGFFSKIFHNASITKKYWFEQKIRLLDHIASSLDLNPKENWWGLIVAKVYEGGQQYSAISNSKNTILDAWKKNTFGLTSETSWWYA